MEWLLGTMFFLGAIAGVFLSLKIVSRYYAEKFRALSNRIGILEKLNEAEKELKKLKKEDNDI
jgi:hypothetical protein